MLFGLVGTVVVSQQQQEVRSRAYTDVNGDFPGDLVGDDYRVAGKVLGNIIGNRNQVSNGVQGGIYGSANSIKGNVGGCINGNDNRVTGNVVGGVVGTNNIVLGTKGTGDCPLPGSATPTSIPTSQPSPTPTTIPTVTPTRIPTPTSPPATCADGIDNNQNELIDGGDPACHTDGNANNPGSYDPNRSEVSVPTQVPTVITQPTATSTPTPTIAVGDTVFALNILLHGIGKGGDSANPTGGGNPNPLHPQRIVTVDVLNAQNQTVLTKTGPVNFSAVNGNFTGSINMGKVLTSNVYTVKLKTTQFLKSLVPGIQNITAGQTNQISPAILINGDINSDNVINILDYNILIGCYSDFLPPVSCIAADKLLSDLDDDGDVNQFDYNLFLRELTNIEGQ